MNTNKRYLNILVPSANVIYLGTERNCKVDDLVNSQYITFKIRYNNETLNIRLNLKYAGWNTENNAISFRLLGNRKLSAYNVDKQQYVDFTTDELHAYMEHYYSTAEKVIKDFKKETGIDLNTSTLNNYMKKLINENQ